MSNATKTCLDEALPSMACDLLDLERSTAKEPMLFAESDLLASLNRIKKISNDLQNAGSQDLGQQSFNEYVKLIHDEALSIEKAIAGYAHLASSEQHQELRMETVSLTEFLPDILKPCIENVPEKCIDFDLRFAETLPEMKVDRQRFALLFTTLLSALFQHVEDHGKIELQVAKFGNNISFLITGNDLNLPSEAQKAFCESGNSKQLSENANPLLKSLSLAGLLVEAQNGFASVSAGTQTRLSIKLPIGTEIHKQKPFDPNTDWHDLNDNRNTKFEHSISIENSILIRKAG